MLYGMRLSFNNLVIFILPYSVCVSTVTPLCFVRLFYILFLKFEKCLEPVLGFILKVDSIVHDSSIHDI